MENDKENIHTSAEKSENKINLSKTFIFSTLVHVVLILIFYFTTVSISLSLPEFVEVSFERAGQPTKPAAKPQRKTSEPTKESAKPLPQKIEEKVTVPKEIQLPKRRMLEDQQPDLQTTTSEKRLPNTSPSVNPQKEASNKETFKPEDQVEQKDDFQPGTVGEQSNVRANNIASKPGIESSLFEIEGKAAERKILTKILPEYPQGYNKEAVIKFRFKVLANGHVAQIIPIMKYDAVLEANALSAFTRWQFNPLPRNVPQDAVEGIITFRYKLR